MDFIISNTSLFVAASNYTQLNQNATFNDIPTAFAVRQLGQNGNLIDIRNYNSKGIIINKDGNIGINIEYPTSNLHVKGTYKFEGGNGTFTNDVYIGGNLEVYGNAISHGNSITDSDINLKSDLQKIENALEKVKTLSGYTFIHRNMPNKRNTGLIAQDVHRVLPEAVYTEGEHLGLAYGNMMGLIVEAIKDLSNQINEIREKIK